MMWVLSRPRYVVVLWVVSVVLVGFGVFWVTQTNYVHRHWATMIRETQHLWRHLSAAAYLLNSTTIQTNETAQGWFLAELSSADDSSYELFILDSGHGRQLNRIGEMIGNLDVYLDIFGFGLNSSMRSAFALSLRNVGVKVIDAYDVTEDIVRGPSLWYFGPPPPNEALLEEAYRLADDANETIHNLMYPGQP